MTWQEVITQIIIPLISGFIGGSIGNVVIEKRKIRKINKMNNKKAVFNNNGDVVNGNKR